ncbi:dTMP kinase [Candidatus Uhrbacteria bacterium]|nr:dTMP kinase [Candidatus Uhrbacteria bacterium]
MKGIFIVFEGAGGTGKTTAATRLVEHAKNKGVSMFQTKEPSSGPIGTEIYDILYGRKPMVSPYELQKKYVQDRAEHIQTVLVPKLSECDIVLCEQYMLCTFAYGMLSCPLESLIDLHYEILGNNFLLPSLTFHFDLPGASAIKRMQTGNIQQHYWERAAKIDKVRQNYHAALSTLDPSLKGKIIPVDATQHPDDVLSHIWQSLQNHLSTSVIPDLIRDPVR